MKTAALDELCEINVGRTPARAEPAFWGPGHKWLSIADMHQGLAISRAKEEITDLGARAGKIIRPGTVLLSFKLSIGKVGIAEVPLYTNEAIAALPVKDEQVLDARYLMRVLEAMDWAGKSNRAAMGATLNKKSLAQVRVPLPSLPEQRRIAAILDHADALRVKRRQTLAHLDTLTQSIFTDMFSAGDFKFIVLKDAIKWSSGKFLPSKAQTGGPHPVYGGNGINGAHHEYMFEEPRLVVGRVGAYCGAVHVTRPFSWVTDNALIATLLRDDLTLDYLLPALSAVNLNQYAGVSGQPSISGGKIGNAKLPVPPVEVQRSFADRVARVRLHADMTRAAESADSELFASLQGRAFRGEL